MTEDAVRDSSASPQPLELARIGVVLVAAAAVWFRLWEPVPGISVIGIAATFVGGFPIFKEALENIFARRMTMELSMTIALVACGIVLAALGFLNPLLAAFIHVTSELAFILNSTRMLVPVESAGLIRAQPNRDDGRRGHGLHSGDSAKANP